MYFTDQEGLSHHLEVSHHSAAVVLEDVAVPRKGFAGRISPSCVESRDSRDDRFA